MTYIHHPQHRDMAFSRQKSQWLIPESEEVQCFERAELGNWSARGSYWSIHLAGALPAPLGFSPVPDAFELHIAKFVGEVGGEWHGYPVAPWLSPFDKPDTSILVIWMNSGYISRPTLAKIKRGKRCAL